MKYFYSDVNESISDISKEGNLEEILMSFNNLSKDDGSFLGLINGNEEIIQFMCKGENKWIADIPKIEDNGSFQRNLSFEQCISFIKDFFKGIPIDTSEFTFISF